MNKRRTFTIEERNNCVYIHTNKTNGKVYIGITGRNPLERWNNGKGYKLNPYFWKAIKKYGWNGFNHDILEDNLTREEAKEKEIYYIKKYDSTMSANGNNLLRNSDTLIFDEYIIGSKLIDASNNILVDRNGYILVG